jgi:hypothetical protein
MTSLLAEHTSRAWEELEKLHQRRSTESADEERAAAVRAHRRTSQSRSCLICLEENPNIATLCCGAACHVNCLADWLSNGSASTCVQCREPLPRLQQRPQAPLQASAPSLPSAAGVSGRLPELQALMQALSGGVLPYGFPPMSFGDDSTGDDDEAIADDEDVDNDDTGSVSDGEDSDGLRRWNGGPHLQHGSEDDEEEGDDETREDDGRSSNYDDDETIEEPAWAPPATQPVMPHVRPPPHEYHAQPHAPPFNSHIQRQISPPRRPQQPTCSYCNSMAAQACANRCCGRCCIIHGRWSCSRHAPMR